MKKLILYILVFIVVNGYSQKYDSLCNPAVIEFRDTIQHKTSLTGKYFNDSIITSSKVMDTLFFSFINQYREFHQLHKLKWSDEMYAMARHHSIYQIKAKVISNYETTDLKDFNELLDCEERFYKFLPYNNEDINYFINENVDAGYYSFYLDSCSAFSEFVLKVYDKDIFKEKAETLAMLYCIYKWDQSTLYRENMLSPDVNMGAISSINYYSTILQNVKSWPPALLYNSTLTFNSAGVFPQTSYYKIEK